jgi:response regulator RpfG family c-di-GMP phosphodiesterase
VAREPFDLVLMDVQMPMMSGLEATAAIRAAESGSGRHVRIVAMTAHAMAGDRERCFEAGMDGYLTKPVTPADLFAAVESAGPPAAVPIDRDAMLERLGGDESLFRDVAALFVEDGPTRLAELADATAARDKTRVRFVAHALKGAAGNLSARRLLAASDALERLAAHEIDDAAVTAADLVAREAGLVMQYFQRDTP